MPARPVRVALVTSDLTLALWVVDTLALETGYRLVSACSHPGELAQMAQSTRPDIVIVDWDPQDRFRELGRVRHQLPGVRIVVWGTDASREFSLAALALGISGVLGRTRARDTLVSCLRLVADGCLCFEEPLQARRETAGAGARRPAARRPEALRSVLPEVDLPAIPRPEKFSDFFELR